MMLNVTNERFAHIEQGDHHWSLACKAERAGNKQLRNYHLDNAIVHFRQAGMPSMVNECVDLLCGAPMFSS
jgi:hypothetical protein